MSDDDIEMGCPDCQTTFRISQHNLNRIMRAVALRYPRGANLVLDPTRIPAGIDLLADLTAEDVALIARKAVRTP